MIHFFYVGVSEVRREGTDVDMAFLSEYSSSSNGLSVQVSTMEISRVTSTQVGSEILNNTRVIPKEEPGTEKHSMVFPHSEIIPDPQIVITDCVFKCFFDKTLSALEDNPENYKGWVYLLQLVDLNKYRRCSRKAYRKFLTLYPLCYNYWIKYSEVEKEMKNDYMYQQVLEDGLKAIPNCIELWILYIAFLRKQHSTEKSMIRLKYESSLAACGLDYHSDKLWNDYIDWELSNKEYKNAFAAYQRVIAIPTQGYVQNYENAKNFVMQHPLNEIVSKSEYSKRRTETIENLTKRENFIHGVPHQIQPNLFRDKERIINAILKELSEIHSLTAEKYKSIKTYEDSIKQTYCTFEQSDPSQLLIWQNYISYETALGDRDRIVSLYKRGLVPCAAHEILWLSYLDYLESSALDEVDLLQELFKKSLFHHPKSLKLNLHYSDFEEAKGNTDAAESILTAIEGHYPDNMDISSRLLKFSKKNGTLYQKYEHYINRSRSKEFVSKMAMDFAKILWKLDENTELAISILMKTVYFHDIKLEECPDIFLQLVEMRMDVQPIKKKLVLKFIDDIIQNQCTKLQHKIMFLKKKLEFVEFYTYNYNLLINVTNEYNECQKLLESEEHSTAQGNNIQQ